MPEKSKPSSEKKPSKDDEKSQHDRAPYQEEKDRDPVKSAEETRHVPNKHGAIK